MVTPSYNQAAFIEETIRSVLLQGYPNLEYMIIDGGSSDDSVNIIKKYQQWLTYWTSEPDSGQSAAINKGFGKASGQLYSWLNSDDYLLESALMHIATAHFMSPTAGAWCGGCRIVDARGNIWTTSWPNRLDLDGIADWHSNHFAQPACFFSQEAWKQCGPLDEGLHYEMDFDLWLKIAKGFRIAKVDEPIAAAHVHKSGKIESNLGQTYAEQWIVQIRHGYEHLAKRDISQQMDRYTKLVGKLGKISRFPLFKPVVPIMRIVARRLLWI